MTSATLTPHILDMRGNVVPRFVAGREHNGAARKFHNDFMTKLSNIFDDVSSSSSRDTCKL